jgi:hypothetical protein
MKAFTAVGTALMTIVLVLGGVSLPAEASEPGAGTLEFQLTASLPLFPCEPPGCTGSFAGTSAGTLAGDHEGNPWTVAWEGGLASGGFGYVDSCDIPSGTAEGYGTLTAEVGSVVGTYGAPSDDGVFPLPVIGVTTTFSFIWTRIGLTAVLTTHASVTLTFIGPLGTTTVTVVSNHLGAAEAVLVPTGPAGTCNAPQPMDAVVIGSQHVLA